METTNPFAKPQPQPQKKKPRLQQEEFEKQQLPEVLQARLISEEGVEAGPPIDLPRDVTAEQLALIVNALLKNEDKTPYLFFTHNEEIKSNLETALAKKKIDTEKRLDIVFQPQAIFKVRPVTRCTSSMPGHAEAVVSINFSPDGSRLASGSGDTTVRLWDLNTETPLYTLEGHKQWVLCVAWSPDGLKLASSCKAGVIIIWDPETGKQLGKSLTGHKKWINGLSWEPYHQNPDCRRIASAGTDGDVRVWDTVLGQCYFAIGGHTGSVTSVKWGGNGLIFSSSKDRTVKAWKASDGTLCKTFSGHAHWVNSLALNTDYVLRTGPFHPVTDKKLKYSEISSKLEIFIFFKYVFYT